MAFKRMFLMGAVTFLWGACWPAAVGISSVMVIETSEGPVSVAWNNASRHDIFRKIFLTLSADSQYLLAKILARDSRLVTAKIEQERIALVESLYAVDKGIQKNVALIADKFNLPQKTLKASLLLLAVAMKQCNEVDAPLLFMKKYLKFLQCAAAGAKDMFLTRVIEAKAIHFLTGIVPPVVVLDDIEKKLLKLNTLFGLLAPSFRTLALCGVAGRSLDDQIALVSRIFENQIKMAAATRALKAAVTSLAGAVADAAAASTFGAEYVSFIL